MDLSIPGSPNQPLSTAAVFADNVQDLLGTGALQINPSATIVVNSIDDAGTVNPGVTTLRDAINQANADSEEDLIVFDRSLFSTAQTITLTLGELDITHSLDIIAPQDTLTGGDLVTVSGNNASRVFEIEKGAVVNLSGLIVESGIVTENNGGGIVNSGTLNLDRCIVRNNSATYRNNSQTQRSGGGIYSNIGKLTVNNSTISGNSSNGIFGNATVNNSTISGNSGNGIYGGGTVNNSTISGNSGNGIYGGGTVNNSTISGNSSNGIYCFNQSLTVNNSTINDNQGSGIYNQFSYGDGGPYGEKTLVSNSIISNNQRYGIYFTSSGGVNPVTVHNSTISGNSTGIYQENGRSLTVTDSTISNNSTTSSGGGIYLTGYPSLKMTVTNSTISGNSALLDGGGIYGNGTVTNSTISGNWASRDGGGIYGYGNGTVTNSTISGNWASRDGGGIYNSIYGGNGTVTNSTISGNWASRDGGGIYGNGTVTNSTISGNSADINGGGIYNPYSSTLTLLFSTVTQNIAASGGGVYQSDVPRFSSDIRRSFNVRNTIIAANLNTENGVNPDVSGTFTSNGYNLIGDSTGSTGFDETIGDIVGTNDWVIDPRLAPLDFYCGSTQTVALLPGSPAINAGDPTILPTDPTTDQRGRLRVRRGRADIGAFESSRKK